MGDGLKRARAAAKATRTTQLPPPGLVCPKPVYAEWSAWVATLKTGDWVVVCHALTSPHGPAGSAIYCARIRRTPGGKLLLEDGHADRVDWSTHMTKSTPGGGERFLAPMPLTPPKEGPDGS